METKANFVLIGAMTVLGIFGLLGLLVWFAKVEIDRQYATYDILFESVSGLGMAGDVRYNGLSVGRVIDLGIDAQNPSRVRVTIEVAADTPVKTDTTAQLNSQGVTGVAFVSLSGGSPEAPLLKEASDGTGIPMIQAERSVIQALSEDAPSMVSEAVLAIQEIRSFLGPENQASVANILASLEGASGNLEQALADFSEISRTVSQGTAEISKFTGRLEEIGVTVQEALVATEETLAVARDAIAKIEPTFTSATGAFDRAQGTIDGIDSFVEEDLPEIVERLKTVLASVEKTTGDIGRQVGGVLDQYGTTAELAQARLVTLEGTLEALDTTLSEARQALGSVETASSGFQQLVEEEGRPLVQEARATLAKVEGAVARMDGILQSEVPAIVEEVRTAVSTAGAVIERVSVDVTQFSEGLDPLVTTGEETLRQATATLQRANQTFDRLDQALGTTEETLTIAGQTFASADRIMAEDLGRAVTDIRQAASQFERTLSTLSSEIPEITGDLRNVMTRALNVIQDIDRTVATSTPPVREFAQKGLPEFTKFAREAQQLVYQMEKLTKRLERDPARFFFGNAVPEFRR